MQIASLTITQNLVVSGIPRNLPRHKISLSVPDNHYKGRKVCSCLTGIPSLLRAYMRNDLFKRAELKEC
jgi:hypothetical protein